MSSLLIYSIKYDFKKQNFNPNKFMALKIQSGAPHKHTRISKAYLNLQQTPEKYTDFKRYFGPVANTQEIYEFQNPIHTS